MNVQQSHLRHDYQERGATFYSRTNLQPYYLEIYTYLATCVSSALDCDERGCDGLVVSRHYIREPILGYSTAKLPPVPIPTRLPAYDINGRLFSFILCQSPLSLEGFTSLRHETKLPQLSQ